MDLWYYVKTHIGISTCLVWSSSTGIRTPENFDLCDKLSVDFSTEIHYLGQFSVAKDTKPDIRSGRVIVAPFYFLKQIVPDVMNGLFCKGDNVMQIRREQGCPYIL